MYMQNLSKDELFSLYVTHELSAAQIAHRKRCSPNKVNYWLARHRIVKRSIADAAYAKHNPSGDPFSFQRPRSLEHAFLYGLGIGLYWGEGTKSNDTSVRLGNSNPKLIKKFIECLITIYGINKSKLRFGLQIFGDMNQRQVVQFWKRELDIEDAQLMKKIVITPHRGVGSYREKTKYGVMTVYFNNRKLRDILCHTIDKVAVE